MKVHFADDGQDDYLHWSKVDPTLYHWLNELIEDVRRHPSMRFSKPKSLKGDLSGWWSRRITGEHRLVYRVQGWKGENQRVEIIPCGYHYG